MAEPDDDKRAAVYARQWMAGWQHGTTGLGNETHARYTAYQHGLAAGRRARERTLPVADRYGRYRVRRDKKKITSE